MRRIGTLATIVFVLSLLGGCFIHTGSSGRPVRRCPAGKVLVKHHGKWKCKKPKKAKKAKHHKRDHRSKKPKKRDHR